MAISFIRATILYAIIICVIRLMGKRQIGEMQPSELVITIFISEIAALPLQDNSIPILTSVVALFALVAYEILTSALNLKSHRLRTLMQGHPVTVIKDGVVDMKALGELRMTVSDLMSALRQKDIFELSQVAYAIFETNGKMSVMLKPEYVPATAANVGKTPPDTGMPYAIVCGGEKIEYAIQEAGLSEKEFDRILAAQHVDIKSIIILTVSKDGSVYTVKEDGKT